MACDDKTNRADATRTSHIVPKWQIATNFLPVNNNNQWKLSAATYDCQKNTSTIMNY
jgi:hypothetical protein